jgi:hypothetical protein
MRLSGFAAALPITLGAILPAAEEDPVRLGIGWVVVFADVEGGGQEAEPPRQIAIGLQRLEVRQALRVAVVIPQYVDLSLAQDAVKRGTAANR